MASDELTPPMKAAISWSAGKDSCLALLLAKEQGYAVEHFLTLQDPGGESKSHGLPPDLIRAQVQALGGQWHPVEVASGHYARVFAAQLEALRETGCEAMVFGDIDLKAHRDWLEPQCERAGLKAVFPLWAKPRAAVADEILARGIRARIVCVDLGKLDARFCGRDYDANFLASLPAEVCVCGEDGEFHSFVWDAPGFAAPLILRDGLPRRLASRPPLRPTELCFCVPELIAA